MFRFTKFICNCNGQGSDCNRTYLRRIISVIFAFALFLSDVMLPDFATADGSNTIKFILNDTPGIWFKNITQPPIAGTESLAIARPKTEIKFSMDSKTVHTITSLIFPAGAANMPFDQPKAFKGSKSVILSTPGLYVFTCKVHPYMFGGVIVDDPKTKGLDLGEDITLINGVTVPTSSDLATRLLKTFFIATNPSNWQDHNPSTNPKGIWHISYPDVDVRVTGGTVVNLPETLDLRYGNDIPLDPLANPETSGVGEVWIDTQFELTSGKDKPGTATAVDATNWGVTRKVALPEINMNNPHNMWTDRDQNLIYQTQWFDSKMAVFERTSGLLIDNISVGEAPAHVMTRVDTDQVHVTLNGSNDKESVIELSPLATDNEGKVDIGRENPHAHWMSHDGKMMVTPNVFTSDSTLHNFQTNSNLFQNTGAMSIATGMMPDSSKYYVASLLDSTITCISIGTPGCKDGSSNVNVKLIDLLANYDPVSGEITGPVGALPIQTPVSPDGRFMVTANTLTGTITILDTTSDLVVNMLPCDPGCHGVQFGAKQGGGYFAYVSSKFSNEMLIIDPDPNNDGDASDAAIAGRVLLAATSNTLRDDTITGNAGMGGQGVLAIPVVYNGWVQNLPPEWKVKLTLKQQNPIP